MAAFLHRFRPNSQGQAGRSEARAKGPRRWLRRAATVAVALPVTYLLAAVVGLVPANRGFQHAADGIDIFVMSNGTHTDLIVPAVTSHADWTTMLPPSDFAGLAAPGSHVQFGWGDRVFYLETPTWGDVKIGNVLRAMFWSSESVMHVAYSGTPIESDLCRRISMSAAQYERLAAELADCFQYDRNGQVIRIPGAAYGPWDAFYLARGNYHVFQTCNCWTGQMLRRSGVRCGIWTPSTISVMWTLPSSPAAPSAGAGGGDQVRPAGGLPARDAAPSILSGEVLKTTSRT